MKALMLNQGRKHEKGKEADFIVLRNRVNMEKLKTSKSTLSFNYFS